MMRYVIEASALRTPPRHLDQAEIERGLAAGRRARSRAFRAGARRLARGTVRLVNRLAARPSAPRRADCTA